MITIVDYDAGNPTSVGRALAALGLEFVITPNAEVLAKAERIVFPGVGHAQSTMAVLTERGLDQALREAFAKGTPMLGVCVGAQLSLGRSEEGNTQCLGLLDGVVKRFPPLPQQLKVPHMGWNRVRVQQRHPLFDDLPEDNELYFVHSYYLDPADPSCVIGTTEHGIVFASALCHDNLTAVQFHPEKSGPLGLALLGRFASWSP